MCATLNKVAKGKPEKNISMACYIGHKCFAVPLSKIHVDKKTLFKKAIKQIICLGEIRQRKSTLYY